MTFGVGEETTAPLPRQLGAYLLLRRLGRGGMGSVYLAAQRLEIFERLCVVKLIRGRHLSNEGHRQRFLDEVQTTLQVAHRNVCRIFDVGNEAGTVYLAMEYVAGRDVRAVLRRLHECGEKMPLALAVHIAAETLDALDAAHTLVDARTGAPLHIVHRDVSPHNVMLGFDGGVKLIDFGVATSASQTTRTDPGLVLGKATYMAPEQAAGAAVDGRADVFATAVCCWEMVAADRYYGEHDLDEVYRLLEGGTYRPPGFATLPAELRALLHRALSHDASLRPSARELAAALRAWASGQGEVSGSAEIRAFLARLFPGEGDQERLINQDLLAAAAVTFPDQRGELTASSASESGVSTTPSRPPRRGAADRGGATERVRAPKPATSSWSRAHRGVVVAALAICLGALGIGAAAQRSGTAGGVFTEDLPRDREARAAYMAGLEDVMRYELTRAQAGLERATRIEAGHAMSHALLAHVLFSAGKPADGRVAAARAAELSAGLPVRPGLFVRAVEREAHDDLNGAVDALVTLTASPESTAFEDLCLARVQVRAQRSGDALETLARARQRSEARANDPLLLLTEARAAVRTGDLERALRAVVAARAEAGRLGVNELRAEALYVEGHVHLESGNTVEARSRFQEALAAYTASGSQLGRGYALSGLSALPADAEGRAASEQWARDALAIFRAHHAREAEAVALNNLAAFAEQRGDVRTTVDLMREALALARENNDPRTAVVVAGNLSGVMLPLGDVAHARSYADDAVRVARTLDDALHLAFALGVRAYVEIAAGNVVPARVALEEALPLARTTGATDDHATVLVTQGALLLQEGKSADARAAFDMGLRLFPDTEYPTASSGRARLSLDAGDFAAVLARRDEMEALGTLSERAEARALLAEAALLAGDVDAAHRDVAAGRALIGDQPLPFGRLFVDIAEAQLLAARGRVAEARALLDRAARDARAAGFMPLALEAAWRSAALGGPRARAAADAVVLEARSLGLGRVVQLAAASARSGRPR